MRVGTVREIKNHEYRVGLTPESARELVAHGHEVWVESGAGQGIGASDGDYKAAGALIQPDARTVFDHCEMIVKVKEPQAGERAMLRRGQILYTYLHLAPDPEQTADLVKSGVTAIAYETVTGGGVVGFNAAQMAVGLGADVTILDRDPEVLERLGNHFESRAKTRFSNQANIQQMLCEAELVIGAVLVPGAAAPKLVTREMLGCMKPGAVLVDVAIDQGGCFETSRATTHEDPTYVVDGVVHYCVANMPGAVARTSTYALNNVTLPHALKIAELGWREAMRANPHLAAGLNVHEGKVTYEAVARELGYEPTPIAEVLG
jgi:alanine dehydrogenase